MQVNCKNCNKSFEKSSTEVRRHPNNFCSRSCAGTFNNKGKRKNPPVERTCVKCGSKFFSSKQHKSKKLCINCKSNLNYKEKTIKEYMNLESIKNKHPSWKATHIRQFNRTWNKDMLTKGCIICGYTTHVELCHIKPISSFSEDTTIYEINSPNNVVPMCPNHHWEFDHGLIKLPEST